MFHYLICLGLCMLSTSVLANYSSDVEHNKRHMINKALQDVTVVVDAILEELDETQQMCHVSCKNAQERENQLKLNLVSLEQENAELRTIKAELAMAQKDLQKSMENESIAQQKLTRLQQQAGKEISHMRDEFEAFKTRLEATTNDFDKVFW